MCHEIPSFSAHCDILILQHPHERRKYYSTAKIVTNALENANLWRGIEFAPDRFQGELRGKNPYLLFPGDDAQDCESVPLSSRDVVVVIDGTWREAQKIVFRNPYLQELPKLSFTRPLRSQYRIRKQPQDGYLSTLESVGHLLKLNSMANGRMAEAQKYEVLFLAFSQMVERQLGYWPRVPL